MASKMASLELKDLLQRFRLDGIRDTGVEIGRGYFAVVKELEFQGRKCAAKDFSYRDPVMTSRWRDDVPRRFVEGCELLSQLHHPNIVKFLGVYFRASSLLPLLVMEYLPNGNLADHLEIHGVPPAGTGLSILRDVALGLLYLHEHSPPIIHGMLLSKPMPNSVLLTASMSAKITVGIANGLMSAAEKMELERIEWERIELDPFMPPEARLALPMYTSKMDIFLLGVLIVYVLSGEWPIPGPLLTIDPQDPLVSTEFHRLRSTIEKIEDGHPLLGLIEQCLNNAPRLRPDAVEVVHQLNKVWSERETLSSDVHEVEDGPALSTGEEKRHLNALKTALAEKGNLEQTIMHCLFFGHPRGGKSSLMKRLTGHPPTPNVPSTGVAEKVVQVEVRKLTTSTVVATLSEWCILNFDDEAVALMAAATQGFLVKKDLTLFEPSTTDPSYEATPPASNEATPFHSEIMQNTSSSSLPEVGASAQLPEDFVPPTEVLKQAIKRRGLEGVEEYLQGSLTLYLTDTGGQIEFQELLPALVAGPSLFFVVFRLDQDLNRTFTIQYLHPDGQSAQPYQSSFSVKETLLQSLASIASMGTNVYNNKLRKQVPLKPKVVLVGTHKDRVSQRKIEQIDRELQQIVRETSLYCDGLIEFASESNLVITVNNLSPDDSDFQLVRSVVERVVERGDFKVSSPSTWLIFSLIIRQQKKRVIAYDECFGIAQKCGIDSRDELNDALWFLNTKVGLVRHFRGEGLEELEEIVIIDPQILFDKITKLIVETFTFHKVTADVHREFKKKGIFPLSVLERMCGSDDEDQLLTVSRLVKLLEHLHIIARLHSDTEEVKYFMPCALAHAASTAPVADFRTTLLYRFKKLVSMFKWEQMLPPPLLVTFKCGCCPKGLFGALSVYLLANKMKSHLKWELQTDQIFKNALRLSVGPLDTVTLSLTPTFIEVSVVPTNRGRDHDFPIEETCVEVRRCVKIAVREVTSSLNYTRDAEHALAFYCPGDHEGLKDRHPGIIQYYKKKPRSIQCEMTEQKLPYGLPKGYKKWFPEHSVTPAEPTEVCHSPDTNLEAVDGRELDSQCLLEITNYLQDLEKTNLYNLGLVFGLRRQRITDLRERCNCLEFCDSIVDCWLQRVDDVEAMNMVPSWRNLVIALRHPRVRQTGLADRIARERPAPI